MVNFVFQVETNAGKFSVNHTLATIQLQTYFTHDPATLVVGWREHADWLWRSAFGRYTTNEIYIYVLCSAVSPWYWTTVAFSHKLSANLVVEWEHFAVSN